MSAAYISTLAEELADIALQHGHNLLGYLLEMAAEEASCLLRQTAGDPSDARA
ncbi:hypothetical protein [Methylopila sp. M107]|uniref:hypothetical protein n=1 Tax=Methylopila sp. M107 TaxID=1101190 RepID=UPI00037266A3|nr:hypothetical protein [Methylopila sp. M107]